MGLTVCIALLTALSAGSDSSPHSKLDVLVIVWGTTVGLALTHWFAMVVASRLVSDRAVILDPLEALIAQTAMALAVATVATGAVLVMSERFDRLSARLVAALFIGALALFETRRGELSILQRVLLSIAVTLVGVAVGIAKWFLS